jgi:hypothetical protein
MRCTDGDHFFDMEVMHGNGEPLRLAIPVQSTGHIKLFMNIMRNDIISITYQINYSFYKSHRIAKLAGPVRSTGPR